jgi:hypothetical protein
MRLEKAKERKMRMAWKAMGLGLALGVSAAQAAPRAALFVQNRAGAQLESNLDAFNDLVGTRLTDAGFEVIRPQDVLDRFAQSRDAQSEQVLRKAVEVLQTAKSEGTADEPTQAASALRLAQMLDADVLVFASLVSLGETKTSVQAYGMAQEATTTTLRVALRVLEGSAGAQLYGDVIAVSDKVAQNANLQVQAGDQVNSLLDRGAAELAGRVRGSLEKIEAAKPEASALAAVMVNSTAVGASVEVDGVVVGSAPGVFHLRHGVHRMRVAKEGYATWEKSVNVFDGQTLNIVMEMSGEGLARKGELEAQARLDAIAREQSAADAQAKTTLAGGQAAQASNSYLRLEGMPQSLTIGETGEQNPNLINVIQQEGK